MLRDSAKIHMEYADQYVEAYREYYLVFFLLGILVFNHFFINEINIYKLFTDSILFKLQKTKGITLSF